MHDDGGNGGGGGESAHHHHRTARTAAQGSGGDEPLYRQAAVYVLVLVLVAAVLCAVALQTASTVATTTVITAPAAAAAGECQQLNEAAGAGAGAAARGGGGPSPAASGAAKDVDGGDAAASSGGASSSSSSFVASIRVQEDAAHAKAEAAAAAAKAEAAAEAAAAAAAAEAAAAAAKAAQDQADQEQGADTTTEPAIDELIGTQRRQQQTQRFGAMPQMQPRSANGVFNGPQQLPAGTKLLFVCMPCIWAQAGFGNYAAGIRGALYLAHATNRTLAMSSTFAPHLEVYRALNYTQQPVLLLTPQYARRAFAQADARYMLLNAPGMMKEVQQKAVACMQKSPGKRGSWERVIVSKKQDSASAVFARMRKVKNTVLVVHNTFGLARQIDSETFGNYVPFQDATLKRPVGNGMMFEISVLMERFPPPVAPWLLRSNMRVLRAMRLIDRYEQAADTLLAAMPVRPVIGINLRRRADNFAQCKKKQSYFANLHACWQTVDSVVPVLHRFYDVLSPEEQRAPVIISLMMNTMLGKFQAPWGFSATELQAMNASVPLWRYVPRSGKNDANTVFTEWALQARTRQFLYNEYSTFSSAIHMLRMGQGAALNSSFVY
jgi:hypothetical protein